MRRNPDWPNAHRIELYFCDNPHCAHVHVLLIDEQERPIAEFTANDVTVRLLQRTLYEKATQVPT